MADKSGIDYVDASWGIWRGCTKTISPCCANCYAEREMNRWNMDFNKIGIASKAMWRKPLSKAWEHVRRVFVCPWSDFFHEGVSHELRHDAFCRMCENPNIIWIIPTKRPQVALDFSKWQIEHYDEWSLESPYVPDKNRWGQERLILLLSCGNQADLERQIGTFLQIPFGLKGLSLEPMLGPVDLNFNVQFSHEDNEGYGVPAIKGLDWVICGGESGPKARPMNPDWVRAVRDDCAAAGVSFYFKQWGEWLPILGQVNGAKIINNKRHFFLEGEAVAWVGKKAAGRMLDGRIWDQYPLPLLPPSDNKKSEVKNG